VSMAIAVVVTMMIVIITTDRTDRIVLTDPIDPTGRIVQTGVMGQA